MKRFFGFIFAFYLAGYNTIFAAQGDGLNQLLLKEQDTKSGTLFVISSNGMTPIAILTLIQSFLLKVLLPVVVIGASLYIAYELFTAEGDESKMKRAWKSIAYSAIGLIAIALSYAIVNIISRLSF
ncbi:hypothetical protein K2X92_03705 [Candidatus Gracilibacteria bacterium]|nr:hypothetical protein [Candidatus Gracilibacteria bacterium]